MRGICILLWAACASAWPALGYQATSRPASDPAGVNRADEQIDITASDAHRDLRAGQFAQAQRRFAALAKKTRGRAAARYRAIACILLSHPDGMIVLTEPYPSTAALLNQRPLLEAGPASLSRPEALEAAICQEAKAHIQAGRGRMNEGKALEQDEPAAAKARYVEADKAFDAADELLPELSRSLRVEIARRRIGMIDREMNLEANKFDALKCQLGRRDLAPDDYAEHLHRMLGSIESVRGDLEAVLRLAAPFRRELVLEIADATARLQRVNALGDILMNQELLYGN